LSQEAEQIWIAPALEWKRWPDGILVYNTESGNTHVLNPASTALLEFLAEGPKSDFEIAHRLAIQNSLQLDDALQTHVKGLLENLADLGIAESVS